jgi:hypothetical protein
MFEGDAVLDTFNRFCMSSGDMDMLFFATKMFDGDTKLRSFFAEVAACR